MVLLKVSMMNLISGVSNEIKSKVKVVLVEVTLMKFILGISKEIKWKVKVVLLEESLMNFILLMLSKGKRKRWYWKYH